MIGLFCENFTENFLSFAGMLGSLKGGQLIRFGKNSLFASGGLWNADENYVILGDGDSVKDAEKQEFCQSRGASLVSRHYTPMSLPASEFLSETRVNSETAGRFLIKISQVNARLWGSAVWCSFDGLLSDSAAMERYADYAAGLVAACGNSAYALTDGHDITSVALIHESRSAFGLYYFGTMPYMRRHGAARHLLTSICVLCSQQNRANNEEKPMVLLATEAGLPFYKDFGFNAIYDAPISVYNI